VESPNIPEPERLGPGCVALPKLNWGKGVVDTLCTGVVLLLKENACDELRGPPKNNGLVAVLLLLVGKALVFEEALKWLDEPRVLALLLKLNGVDVDMETESPYCVLPKGDGSGLE
jgi:hypothetical protein